MDQEIALQDLMALLKLSAGPGEEDVVVKHLTGLFEEWGIPQSDWETDDTCKQSEYGGRSGNLILRMNGHGKGPRKFFSAHMDTVPYAVGTVPKREGDRIVSGVEDCALGGDDRTGCTVLLQCIRALLKKKGDHAPVTFGFFVQEELGLVGARGLDTSKLGDPFPTLGFNFDGDRPESIFHAVIGTERIFINITGKAVHASYPDLGISAALVAAHALSDLGRGGWFGKVEKPEGKGMSNAGVLEGGRGTNVVVPEFKVQAEARSYDPAFRERILDTWRKTFIEASKEVTDGEGNCASVAFEKGPTYEAYRLSIEDPVVQEATRAVKQCGLTPQYSGHDGGDDSVWINAKGIPAVTLGSGQFNPHQNNEYVDLPNFYTACQVGEHLVDGA